MHDPHDPHPVFTQRIERTVVMLIFAIEIPSVFVVGGVLIWSGVAGWVVPLVLVGMLVLPFLLSRSRVVIRLTEDRLRWSFFPFWRGSVAYDAITGAEVIEVDAMRDFGGWGPKLGLTKRFGKVMGAVARSGPAVRVERSDKARALVITSDDADALCAALLDRAIGAQADDPG